ncbi:unnamed protein product [Adineta steineri]|uniref:F-box domain-containing protein n=1 Tax=Adineta steineri TaxID=433720 RepID=A0A813S1U9_9BILA|nr:unnamed protein product [Adineta steineri]
MSNKYSNLHTDQCRANFKNAASASTVSSASTNTSKEFRDKGIVITQLENLSNEICYEVFDYLDEHAIYKAFDELNARFQKLITTSSFLLKIYIDNESHLKIEDCCKNLRIPNNRILSFHLHDPVQAESFFQNCTFDSTFTHLKSILLHVIDDYFQAQQLKCLESLPHLLSLTLVLYGDQCYNQEDMFIDDIYEIIFTLPYLEYSSLSVIKYNDQYLPTFVDKTIQSNSITSLHMDYDCDINSLLSVLSHTPQLHQECSVKFDRFQKFVKDIGSQIKIFWIQGYLPDDDDIEPDQWRILIEKDLPQLEKILLRSSVTTDVSKINSVIDQLNSSFWIDHQWNIRLEIEPDESSYFVSSYISTRFDFDQKIQTMSNSTSNELLISNVDDLPWQQPMIEQLIPILSQMKFTRIYSCNSQLSLDNFIQLINLLPCLDSLKMDVVSEEQCNSLSVEDKEKFLSVSMLNTITKVVQKMNIELTEFLIKLCPHMTYFQVDSIKDDDDDDIEELVQFILLKRKTDIPHLQSLCLNLRNVNDELITILRNIMDSEKITASDYLIKSSGTFIILQWKLQ